MQSQSSHTLFANVPNVYLRVKEYCEMAITYSNAVNRKEGEEGMTRSTSPKSGSNPHDVPTTTTSPTSHSKIGPKSLPSRGLVKPEQ